MHAIIGVGISGSMRLFLDQDVVAFDKAKFSGGRTSTKSFEKDYFCDIGATFFKESCKYRINQTQYEFSCLDFFTKRKIECIQYQYTNNKSTYFSKGGLQKISQNLIQGKEIHLDMALVSFEILKNQKFLLHFLDGSTFLSDHLTITAPLPQAISFFPNCKIKEEWENFLKPYFSYRKTLVAAAYWRSPPEKFMDQLKQIPQKTILLPNQECEYISIESLKSGGKGLVFMIQYSSEFSEKHFDNWRMEDRSPTDFCIKSFQNNFQNFLSNNELLESISQSKMQLPDRWCIHKWRYAQSEYPMLSKYDDLDFDSEAMKMYIDLVQKTNIRITGDWLFGPRIERIVAGEYLWKDPRPSLNGEI